MVGKEQELAEKPSKMVTKLTPRGKNACGSGVLLAQKLLDLAGQRGYSAASNNPFSVFDIRKIYVGGEHKDGTISGGQLVGSIMVDGTTRGAPFAYIFDEEGQHVLVDAAGKAVEEGLLFDVGNVTFTNG